MVKSLHKKQKQYNITKIYKALKQIKDRHENNLLGM